jgi:hypothetical protein
MTARIDAESPETTAAGARRLPPPASDGPGPDVRHAGRDRPAGGRRVGVVLLGQLGALAAFTAPAVVLWWHVWTGSPSSTLTCGCGDPSQFVWFLEWPAWALTHGHDPFYSTWVNAPTGANLLDNASGPLAGIVLAPVTWLFGPVASLNVLLTLAPGLNAWVAWWAFRRFTVWSPAAIPAALLYGYSPVVLGTIEFGHGGWAVLVVPPLLVIVLDDLLVRQRHRPWVDGLWLAALVIAQFFLSTEVLAMTVLMAGCAVIVLVALNPREVAARLGFAVRGTLVAAGACAVVLAGPLWLAVSGPETVNGAPWALTPLAGAPLDGVLDPGDYRAPANGFSEIGGFFGRAGPGLDYLGVCVLVVCVVALVVARHRRALWFAAVMAVLSFTFSLGYLMVGAPGWLSGLWLPWRALDRLPYLDQVVPQRFSLFTFLFIGMVMTIGIDAARTALRSRPAGPGTGEGPPAGQRSGGPGAPSGAVETHGGSRFTGPILVACGVLALVPIAATYPAPLAVQHAGAPLWFTTAGQRVPDGAVLLTIPYPASGSEAPMLWQAVDTMHFRLAGAGLRLRGPGGHALGPGAPGSATAILEGLTNQADPLPGGTPGEYRVVRAALERWGVDEVVITGWSRDPVYAAEFFTAALGELPARAEGAWVWTLRAGTVGTAARASASLSQCRATARADASAPLAGPDCVLGAAGASGT